MSNLSDLLPAGASAKSITATDSGSGITSGKPVILETAGTVTEISGTDDALGTSAVFESAEINETASTFDSDSNKVVVVYRDGGNSWYGTAAVGTVSGTSISYGTPVVFESANTEQLSTTFDSDSNKVVIAYKDNGNSSYGTAIVGTVSGTAISFGTAVVFESANTLYTSCAFDSTANKVVIAYSDLGNSWYGTAIVGTVSGTAISFGTAVVFAAADSTYTSSAYDSNADRTVISYKDGGNSGYGTAIVGTVSGTAISFGTEVVYSTAITSNSTVFDSNSNKIVIAYRHVGDSNYGTAIVGTVSGTSISFGTGVVFEEAESEKIAAIFDSNANKVVIAYQDEGNSGYGTVIAGTVSGTAISFETAVVFEAANSQHISATFDSDSNVDVIAYKDTGNSDYGTGIVFSVGATNLTTSNFLGIADEAISASASGVIVVQGGTSAKLTSLTIGSNYYVQGDGTFAASAGSPSVKAGLAISATSLLLSGDS